MVQRPEVCVCVATGGDFKEVTRLFTEESSQADSCGRMFVRTLSIAVAWKCSQVIQCSYSGMPRLNVILCLQISGEVMVAELYV